MANASIWAVWRYRSGMAGRFMTMHTARWDHGHDFAGKRVAVIGTGATALQLVPELARKVAQLYVENIAEPAA